VKLALIAALAACGPRAAMTTSPAVAGVNVGIGSASSGTIVATLAPDVPTAIVDGPFTISAVNPGRDLALAIAADRACTAASLVWFAYSGGGIVVGPGQTLCVRDVDRAPATQGFSGRREPP
jgi:hypothetical protein